MTKEDNIIVPRWFLEVVEDTLQIQHNINEPDKKKTGESCQDRNIKESLNGVRKLLDGEELTGMERLEKLRSCIPSDIDQAAEEMYPMTTTPPTPIEVAAYYNAAQQKLREAFKAGVKWVEEQGVDAQCVGSYNPVSESPNISFRCITLFYKLDKDTPYIIKGDKLKVILRRSNNMARPKIEFIWGNNSNQKEEE